MPRTKWANQFRKSRNAFPSIGGPLERNDKARICILAREAFDKAETTQDFETWRRHEQFLAVTGANPLIDRTSRLSLRDCTQRDMLKLTAHFQNLIGEPGRAVKSLLRIATQDHELAMRKLEAECTARSIDISYPAKICAKQFKCALDDASPKQLWCLVFTVRNRRKKIKTADPF
jgi:hypothetical protein